MDQSPRLSLSYLMPAQAQKHVTVNETFRRLDQLVQQTVLSRTVAAEPGAPNDGDAYILPASPTGTAWATFAQNNIAAYQDGAWTQIIVAEGFSAWVSDTDEFTIYDGAAWNQISGGGGETAAKFGVNTTADATNKLTVKSNAVMFDALDVGEGGTGDSQVKVNKEAVGDTASHLFQTGFSGRAEFGLTGDDDFHIKVSADGSSWTEAMFIDKDNGYIGVGTTNPTAQFQTLTIGSGGSDSKNSVAFEVENAFNFITYSCFRNAGTSSSMSPFFLIKCSNGTKASPTTLADTQWVGGFAFRPYVAGTKNDFVNRAVINAEVDGTVSGDSVPVSLIFRTSATNGFSDRMRIKSDGKIGIGTASPGSLLHVSGGGLQVGAPTGGDKGAGAINAQAVYDDNALLSCYVFDQALDGAIDDGKWDEKVPDRILPEKTETDEGTGEKRIVKPQEEIVRTHEPMRKFRARIGTLEDPLTLDGYAKHWREKRHLTSMPDEATFDPVDGQLSSGEWVQRLVETVEIQAVLIEQLNQRIKTLETAKPAR